MWGKFYCLCAKSNTYGAQKRKVLCFLNVICRLRNLLPKVENEMKLVARREIIKARLGELDTLQADSKSVNAEKTTLRNELKRITSLVQPMIAAWEKTNAQPFLYRGFRYLTLMTGGSNSSA